jgi:hypothetical protein
MPALSKEAEKHGFKCKWCGRKFRDRKRVERHSVICGMRFVRVKK